MRTLLGALKAIALIAFSAVCISVALLAIRVEKSIQQVSSQIAPLAKQANLDLEESHRLILEAGLTAMEARKASAKESAYLDQWNKHVSDAFDGLHYVMVSIASTSDSTALSEEHVATAAANTLAAAQQTIDQAQPALKGLADETVALQVTTKHLDTLIADPANAETVKNIGAASASLAVAADEGKQWFHHLLHPTWPERIYHVSIDALHAAF